MLSRRNVRISKSWHPVGISSGTATTAGGCIEPFVSIFLSTRAKHRVKLIRMSPVGNFVMPRPEAIKVLGRRTARETGLPAAAKFLDMVIALRGDKPFIPRGVHRFSSFEESQAWSIRMMTRRRNPGRRS